jgi:hypothetical protein
VPTEPDIEVPMDVIAVLDSLRAQITALGALQLHLMIGPKAFQHGIATLTRPGKELTKTVDGHPIATLRNASIGRLKLLALGLRV